MLLAKAKPGTLTYGSPGTGSQPHLGGEFLKLMADIDIVHVPYNGTAPARRDLLGGQITFMFARTSAALPLATLLRTMSAHHADIVKCANIKAE